MVLGGSKNVFLNILPLKITIFDPFPSFLEVTRSISDPRRPKMHKKSGDRFLPKSHILYPDIMGKSDSRRKKHFREKRTPRRSGG